MREIVVVGSENPSKLQAVQLGFEAVFPDKDFQFLCVNADSDVSAQPMGDAETVTVLKTGPGMPVSRNLKRIIGSVWKAA